nr:MAG: major capsid protein [Microvirus sp.]
MRTLLSAPPTSRVGRYPKHPFMVRELAYTAQPFFIAPVLPGETMDNLYFESRVITDPVLNPIIGWKKQYFFFYVRITDLLSDTIRDMFIDPTNTDLTATLGSASSSQPYYSAKGGMNWAKRCVERITAEYFRDEGEAWNSNVVTGDIPIVPIRDRLWMDSITDDDDMPVGADPSAMTDASDLEALMNAFEHLRAMGVANMTYEDFIRSYGIPIPSKDENKPELLANFSDFQYPSNTINPSSGAPSSAVSWVFKNGSRKPKFFKEPGFVVGISVTRPKLYFGGLKGSLADFMSRAWDWMPRYLMEGAAVPMPETSLKRFGADTGPLGDRSTATDEYWVDMRDLLIHGDQFQNMAMTADNANPADSAANHLFALPPGDNHHAYKYLTEAQCKAFFVDAAGTAFHIRQDGYVSLSVKGKQVDYTAANIAEA